MSELAESVSQTIEQPGGGRLNALIGVFVAVGATFMALCNVKDGNICQAMAQAQAKAVDTWTYYQAKGMKLNLAEATLDQLRLQKALLGEDAAAAARALLTKREADYQDEIKRYLAEKEAIKKDAEELEATYDRLNQRDDQFDMSEAFLSISLAVFGISALTRRRGLFVFSCVVFSLGIVFGFAGFVGLGIHPNFLAQLLG